MSDSDDQERENQILINKLRSAEKKYKAEIRDLKDTLEEKDEEIIVLQNKLKRVNKRVGRFGNSENEADFDNVDKELQQTKEELSSLVEELKLKDATISESETRINAVNKHVKNLEEEIHSLNNELDKTLKNLKLKEEKIENLSEDITKQIAERDGHIRKLEESIKTLNNNQICNRENSISRSKSERSLNEELLKTKASFINEMNKRTGNKFDSLENYISLIKKLSNDSERKMRKEFNKDDNCGRVMGFNNERLMQLETEIENLHDIIYDLESKSRADEKRYKKQLCVKEEEIEELNEEIAISISKKPKDNKSKMRIKDLEEKAEELETDLESKNDEIKSKDKKIKELETELESKNDEIKSMDKKIKDIKNKMETTIEELQEVKQLMKKDNMELNAAIEKQNRETEKIVKEKEEDLAKKSKALVTMKKKIDFMKDQENDLNAKIAQYVVDLDECRISLQYEKEKYDKLNVTSNNQKITIEGHKTKCRKLEEEIHSMKVKKFRNSEDHGAEKSKVNQEVNKIWYPTWWKNHNKLDDFKQELIKPECANLEKEPPEIKISTNNMQVACPNCQTMYSSLEIEDHVKECLEHDN